MVQGYDFPAPKFAYTILILSTWISIIYMHQMFLIWLFSKCFWYTNNGTDILHALSKFFAANSSKKQQQQNLSWKFIKQETSFEV